MHQKFRALKWRMSKKIQKVPREKPVPRKSLYDCRVSWKTLSKLFLERILRILQMVTMTFYSNFFIYNKAR